jgi:hypothetical protein
MKSIIYKIAKTFLHKKKHNKNIYSICINSSGELNDYCINEITHK